MGTCIGHYAGIGITNPFRGKVAKLIQYIELMDTYTLRSRRGRVMEAILNVIMPPPVRFKAVWRLAREKKQLFAWKPIAPDGFVALGAVYTETGKYLGFYVDIIICVIFDDYYQTVCVLSLLKYAYLSRMFFLHIYRCSSGPEYCAMLANAMVCANNISSG